MAGRWEGFSDDDIKFYLNKSTTVTEDDDGASTERRVATVGKARKVRRERNLPSHQTDGKTTEYDISEAALLIKRPISQESEHDNGKCLYLSNGETAPTTGAKTDANTNETDVQTSTENSVLGASEPLSEETLEKFHARQKILEEHNQQRKAFLARLLSDRKKQTSQEAQRLQKIQDELHKLDVLLSDDVRILRGEIETASKDFGEAQKRFSKAEKEFLDAKQCLFAKMERKELLTKHLCTIIEQNEMRKAQKLSELMEKLSASGGTDSATPPAPPVQISTSPTEDIKPKVPLAAKPAATQQTEVPK